MICNNKLFDYPTDKFPYLVDNFILVYGYVIPPSEGYLVFSALF